MSELAPRVQNSLRPLDVGEARADGVEKFFGVLARERNVWSERGSGLAARREHEGDDTRERNESDRCRDFHPRKFNSGGGCGKARPVKSNPGTATGAPLCKRLHIRA